MNTWPDAQRLGEPHLPPSVGRPYSRDQAVAGPVGDRDRLGLVVEGNDDLDRAEDFLLRKAMAGDDIGEQGRGDIMPAARGVVDDLADRCGLEVGAVGEEPAHDRLLLLGDERPDVEVGVRRADLEAPVAGRHPLDDLAVDAGARPECARRPNRSGRRSGCPR